MNIVLWDRVHTRPRQKPSERLNPASVMPRRRGVSFSVAPDFHGTYVSLKGAMGKCQRAGADSRMRTGTYSNPNQPFVGAPTRSLRFIANGAHTAQRFNAQEYREQSSVCSFSNGPNRTTMCLHVQAPQYRR